MLARSNRWHVSFTDEEGTRGKSGPGLLRITLGIEPEADDAVPANRRLYRFEVACPNAMYTPPHEARWSHDELAALPRLATSAAPVASVRP